MGVGIVARKGYAARGCVLGAVLGVHIGVWVPAEDGVDDTAARLVGMRDETIPLGSGSRSWSSFLLM